jgi:hypothetical protein
LTRLFVDSQLTFETSKEKAALVAAPRDGLFGSAKQVGLAEALSFSDIGRLVVPNRRVKVDLIFTR